MNRTGDFSIAVWVHTDEIVDHILGDIAGQYDPIARRGFQLSLMSYSGVTSSQSNSRNLSFGIDDASEPVWRDCGRPGNAVLVYALTVHDGALYAGTYEAGEGESGHVYRYEGGDRWIDCGSPDPCNAVTSLVVYQGRLYAGVSHYRASGSALPDSPNRHPGGRIYRYEEDGTWRDCGKLGETGTTARTATYGEYVRSYVDWRAELVDTVHGLAVYDGELYAIPMYHQGVYRYDGRDGWLDCGSPGVRMMSLTVFDGHLFGAGNEGKGRGGVYRYDGGTQWTRTGEQPDVNQVYSFAVYDDKLHVGTWPEATVFRYEGGETWRHCGRLGEELEVMGMAVYNGALYAGTLPLAQVYRYDGGEKGTGVGPQPLRGHPTPVGPHGERWSLTGRLDHTPDVRYRRAWSMAVYDGKLFCGTLPSGRVFAMEAGQCVTLDRALPTGWRHVAAVRAGDRLSLYVDGQLAATSTSGAGGGFDLSTDAPLRIGGGMHGEFNGRVRDARLYRRALTEEEIGALFRDGRD